MTQKPSSNSLAETEILELMERLKPLDNIPNRVFYLLHEAINVLIRDREWLEEHEALRDELETKNTTDRIYDHRKD